MWDDFELHAEQIPTWKLIFHVLQIVFAFVLWCLEIAVFRAADAPINGNNGWTFAAFFLTIPAWIYLAMAPRFPRTRKLAQPHAMVGVDLFFTLIWLSAFATQAAYNTANSCGSVCGISKAIVGLGFFVFLFFCVTTFLSIYTLKYYQWNHRLPGYDKGAGSSAQNIDPDKAAFSMTPHDEEAYAPVNLSDRDDDTHMGAHSDYSADPYGAPGGGSHVGSDPFVGGGGGGTSHVGTVSSYGGLNDNPFRQDNSNPFESDTEYRPAGSSIHSGLGLGGGGSGVGGYAAPSAHDDYDDGARFPNANYDRIAR
ncbi:hypothetical protein B0T17DRAFT_497284 [Bombardia bombarda]|uniref:MARVEL domain-containing protein n=1 Tax=Bombardia bombarda TaxID=252184 RepID=A0AA39WIF4_9PEZI|nr:hypothetical protein B0T17DRAFT_497284 [Bombardia bombarda]